MLAILLKVSDHSTNDNLRSAAVKFTETVILRFSDKGGVGRRKTANEDDFNLEDVPDGHPTITKESLQDIGQSCFDCLRGWCRTGGQVTVIDDESIQSQRYEFSFVKQAEVSFRLAEQVSSERRDAMR